MSRPVYNATVQAFTHNLKNLAAMLRRAKREAKSRGIDESVIMTARLAPDMLPLTAQVMMACDHAKGCSARLAGVTPPSFDDDQATFAELEGRIKQTVSFIRSLKVPQFEGADTREILLHLPVGKLRFNGADYLNNWAMPNFYFHLTTVYAILRHNGVGIGKADYLGKVPGAVASGPIAKMMGLSVDAGKAAPKKRAAKKTSTKAATRKTKASKAAPKKAASKTASAKKASAKKAVKKKPTAKARAKPAAKRYLAKTTNQKPVAGTRPNKK